jgi:multidrug resistance efflux pump
LSTEPINYASTNVKTAPTGDKIPTPMKLQMRRFRYSILPIAVFLLALMATIYLWKGYGGTPHGLGEVSAISLKVAAPLDGRLAASEQFPRLYDHVNAGDVLARFEADQDIERAAALQEDRDRKQKEFAAAQEELKAAQAANDKPKAESLKLQISSLKRALDEVDAEYKRVDRRVTNAEVKAPISGTVTAVWRQPGEFAKQGQDILTITQDAGGHIISFVRPGTGVMPKKDMKVVVRGQDSTKSASTIVQEVGTQVQPVPEHQLVNARKPEWGFAVRIAMPNSSELPLRPGELVTLSYDASASTAK